MTAKVTGFSSNTVHTMVPRTPPFSTTIFFPQMYHSMTKHREKILHENFGD